jgi:hypothetical protein
MFLFSLSDGTGDPLLANRFGYHRKSAIPESIQ